jgi:putative aldouronate transport system permease protein
MVSSKKGFFVFVHIIMLLMVIVCLFPFLIMIMSSVTSEKSLVTYGYSAFPREFGLDAFKYLFNNPFMVMKAYGITILVTVLGTGLSLVITILFAYGLSIKNLPYRNVIAFFLFFTMLFNGGTVPTYMIWTQVFHIKNTVAALVFPKLLVFAFYVIIMRSYFQTNIPEEIKEAAQIDGAREARILKQIVIPMAAPIIVSIGLMIGISYWNDWINGLYYITNSKLYSIQQILNRMLSDARFLTTNTSGVENLVSGTVPTNGLKMAMAAIGAVPIMLLLPFFQKYYIKGLTLGAVKG